MYICTSSYTYICTHIVYIYVHKCERACVYICVNVFVCTYTYVYINICIHIYI